MNIISKAVADLDAVTDRRSAAWSRIRALHHPSVVALWSYRISHVLYLRGLRRVPLFISAVARRWSHGIDIHPAAQIGNRLFIDAAGGVVIGETACIGDDVTIGSGAQLCSVLRKRGYRSLGDPILGDRVVVGESASIVGAVHVGAGAVVAPHALVVADVPPGATVAANASSPAASRLGEDESVVPD